MYFDEERADRAVRFIQNLKHTKGRWAGIPFNLIPWQEETTREIFGTVNEDGKRVYKTAYVEVPKKNGKSELAAAIALYMLFGDGEAGAEVYSCAVDREQASIVFDIASYMVRQNNSLRKRCKIIDSTKRIVIEGTNSFFKVLSADVPNKHGINPSCIIFDELHAQPNSKLWDVMTFGSMDAREQPLLYVITTAGNDPHRTTVGWDIHERAEQVLAGVRTEKSLYPVIYGLDADDPDWDQEDKWREANPSLGYTLKMDTLHDLYEQCKGKLKDERLFRQLRLNQWVRETDSGWLSLELWDKNGGAILSNSLQGRTCYGGLDLSSKKDLTSFQLVFPPEEEGEKTKIIGWFFLPEDNMEARVLHDDVPYDEWAKDKNLILTSGNMVDYRYIKQIICDCASKYDIQEVGFDPWNASQIALQLEDEGVPMAEVPQTYKHISPAMKEFEGLVEGEHINHNNDPILRWNFGNLQTKVDENENIRYVKGKSKERIDGVVAVIIAISRMVAHEKKRSVYEERGVRSG